MDASTRYSAGSVIPNTGMKAAIEALDSHWIFHFWAPNSIQFDQASASKEFIEFLPLHDIIARPVPARRHNKMKSNLNTRSSEISSCASDQVISRLVKLCQHNKPFVYQMISTGTMFDPLMNSQKDSHVPLNLAHYQKLSRKI